MFNFTFTLFIAVSLLWVVQTQESPNEFNNFIGENFICVSWAALLILICLTIICIWWIIRIQKLRLRKSLRGISYFEIGAVERLNYKSDIKKQANLLPYNKQWEFPNNKLKLGEQLGSGEFRDVFKAKAKGIINKNTKTIVTVQTINEYNTRSRKVMISDLKIMIHLGRHLNVVNLLGACTGNMKQLKILVEYCCFGNIHQYLQRHIGCFVDQITPDGYLDINIQSQLDSNIRLDGNVTLKSISTYDLICWSWQIARGMQFLNSRNIIHEDLSLRNILLAEKNIVKICNFGIAKTIYDSEDCINIKSNKIQSPTKWMAIESLRDRIFSFQSDVWAFGIVLWEIFSLAEMPYQNIPDNLLQRKLIEGHRMEKPKYANSKIYYLMLDCWKCQPMNRPSFIELSKHLGDFLTHKTKSYYIDLNEDCIKMNSEVSVLTDYLSKFSAPTYKYLCQRVKNKEQFSLVHCQKQRIL